ncbi:MAG: DUF4238 domain-containing protein [Planctomycetaceae bacterium]|nr:DUF4238 domain-containing protein [Planctomycetaceae bacterium]
MPKEKPIQPEITKRNHYVPQWYQRRFIENGTQYWCLDKNLTNTESKPYHNLPKYFFQQKHLYTIDLFGQKSDIVEKKLFGDIDIRGSKSIDKIAIKEGWETIDGHQSWLDFMDFMNAQKLRTPKGLDWTKKYMVACGYNLESLNNNIVLHTMQTIRHLYCSMWTEAIWEIVSADDSKTKFIISDNPVTFYNHSIKPDSDKWRYPDEPSLEMIGTQTIYPLSLNYCLILTHRQLALNHQADPLQNRINARYYDDVNNKAIFNFLDIIHERSLIENDICIINYVLKQQAKSYIAGAKKEWLYPEKYINNSNWHEFYKIFLPPQNKVHISTGIFMGHIDGSIEGFDPYGKRITDSKKIDEMKNSINFIKKYTRKENFSDYLTKLLDQYNTPNIQEQNLLLVEGIVDIFKMKDNKFEDFKNNFNAENVRTFYLLIDDLWPAGVDTIKPISSEQEFSLFYLGELDYQIIFSKLLNLSLYFDKFYICNPFPHPCCTKESYNPILNSEHYIVSTYNFILTIITLLPWIDTGQLQILPNPFALDFSFREIAMANAKKKKQYNIQGDQEFFCRQMMLQLENILFITPDEILERTIKNLIPNIPQNIIFEIAQDTREKKKKNTLLVGKTIEKLGEQYLLYKTNEMVEIMFYMAKLTNAIPYTYLNFQKNELDSLNDLQNNSLQFKINTFNCDDGYLVRSFKDVGILEKVRLVLRKFKNEPFNQDTHKELEKAIFESQSDWETINVAMHKYKNAKYSISQENIEFNLGNYDLPIIHQHLKKTFDKNEISSVHTYLFSGTASDKTE